MFDTITAPSDAGGRLRLSLTFIPGRRAAGAEGQGLEASTCAWVDRPVRGDEPRQIRFTPAIGDSTPRLTARDSSVYWSFLAYDTDSGHFTGVGHRHWEAAPAAVATSSEGSRLRRFDPRHLHWYLIGVAICWVLIAWIPSLTICAAWSGWRRLAALYPAGAVGRGRRFRCGFLIMGLTNYRGYARLTADVSHLHFSMWPPFRPGHRPFSVPWSDITVAREGWPWFPFKGKPVRRLTLARRRELRILVDVKVGDEIIAAGDQRLELSERPAAAAAAP